MIAGAPGGGIDPGSPWDVIVTGGGPAGSTVATLAARHGLRVLLLDRETFPRFRVGESLMPATYWTFRRLGVLERLKASGFPRKHSVQFFSESGRSGAPFYFREFDPHESSATWQVDRAEFDRVLLDNAMQAGVEVRQPVNVKEVLFEGSRAVGVRVDPGDGGRVDLRATVVVDASGQTALISRQLGLKNADPELRHASFFTRYRGARRDAGIDEGATLVLQSRHPRTWFWYIPLPDDHVSVGVVGPVDRLLRGREGGPQQVYDEEAAGCTALGDRVRDAEQVMEVRVMRDFSYISRRIAGDGWVMAGDAFGFLDPIYSTGVFFALESAALAADAVCDAFDAGDFSGSRLGRHGDRYVAGLEAMRKMVYAYYDEDFNFRDFLDRHPGCRESLVHLLIGNVFRKPADDLFDAMGRTCRLPEARALDPVEERS